MEALRSGLKKTISKILQNAFKLYSWRQSILKQARKESKQEQNPLFFKMWMKINQNGDGKSII